MVSCDANELDFVNVTVLNKTDSSVIIFESCKAWVCWQGVSIVVIMRCTILMSRLLAEMFVSHISVPSDTFSGGSKGVSKWPGHP